MSYTYLQEQEGASLAECSSDTPQFALWKLNHIAEKSYCNASEMESCRDSQFGTISEPLTESRGKEKLTLFAADSHAKTLARQGKERESQREPEVGFGMKWRGLLVKYDQDLFLLKTVLCSEREDSTKFCEALPKWGMMQDGECLGLAMPALRTSGLESGYWPTPTCVSGAMYLESNAHSRNSMSLASAVHYWITPMARDHKGHTNNPKMRGYGGTLPDQVRTRSGGGQLNPTWVEWLMGWPIEWTDLKPLETDKFQEWFRSHGGR